MPQAGFELGSLGLQAGVLPSELALLDPPLKFHNLCAPPGKIYMPLFLVPIQNLFFFQEGRTVLILAASQGKLDFIPLLLSHGADIHAEDNDKATALHSAAREGHADVCLELLVQILTIF